MVDKIKKLIRDIPDYPKEGILYKDITPLLANHAGFSRTINLLAESMAGYSIDELVAIESRGFIFGSALSIAMQLPLQIVRKPGKLPFRTRSLEYELEYGTDRIEIHSDAIQNGKRYAVIDDLIATGGTAQATEDLITQLGGKVVCSTFVMELCALNGRLRLSSDVCSLIQYTD
jgi:adenine phosphoribosyltransferase